MVGVEGFLRYELLFGGLKHVIVSQGMLALGVSFQRMLLYGLNTSHTAALTSFFLVRPHSKCQRRIASRTLLQSALTTSSLLASLYLPNIY
jgi:hypothetical protein